MFENRQQNIVTVMAFPKDASEGGHLCQGAVLWGMWKADGKGGKCKEFSSGHMVRYYGYYCPSSHRLDDLQCPAKSIGQSVLDDMVKIALHQEFALSGLRPGRLVKEYERQAEEQKQQIRQEISSVKNRRNVGKREGAGCI